MSCIAKGITIGELYGTNTYGKVKVNRLYREKGRVKAEVSFLDTGTTKGVHLGALRKGTVKDEFAPSICGVGFLGIKGLRTQYKVAYDIWYGMLRRCYVKCSRDYEYYGARGVSVDKEWHNFSNFLCWWKINYVTGFELDKDLLSPEGTVKVYNKDVCCFIPKSINSIISSISSDNRGGVRIHGKMHVYGGEHSLCERRTFPTEEEAFAYRSEHFYLHLEVVERMRGLLPERVLGAVIAVLKKEVLRTSKK